MCKRITISHLVKLRRDWLDTSITGLLLGLGVIGSASTALGQCRPPAPAPCAADGMCYPYRNTWGNYTTNWRPFPGDAIGIKPTEADGQGVEIQDKLPTFIVPRPDQEDLRGPARPTRPAAAPSGQPVGEAAPALGPPLDQAPPANGEEPAGPAAEEPAALDNLDLPGFGPPQGTLQPLPRIEDGPPALPSALSRAIATGPSSFTSQQHHSTTPTVSANGNSAAKPLAKATGAQSRFVTPTANNIELTNPAAKNVQKTMDQELQQAIYYEASDADGQIK